MWCSPLNGTMSVAVYIQGMLPMSISAILEYLSRVIIPAIAIRQFSDMVNVPVMTITQIVYMCLLPPAPIMTRDLMSSWSKSSKHSCWSYLKYIDLIRSEFFICHNSLAVVTCANSWPDGIIKIIVTLKNIFTMFQLWARKPFVPGLSCGGDQLCAIDTDHLEPNKCPFPRLSAHSTASVNSPLNK